MWYLPIIQILTQFYYGSGKICHVTRYNIVSLEAIIGDGGSPELTENAKPTEDQVVEDENTQPEPDVVAEQNIATEEEIDDTEATKALEEAQLKAQQNYDKWQRALADFDNYKKRVERERIDVYENAAADVIKAVLPIIDDFERAFENIPDDLKDNSWVDGTSAIGRKFNRLLETYDIQIMDPVGEPFDPDKHQGLGIDEASDMESGHVTQTLQKGYTRGDKLLRPALVRVSG